MFSSRGFTVTSSSFKGEVVDTITLPYSATITYPVISADGSTLYVSVSGFFNNWIQVIDTATATITDSFTGGTGSPHSMVMSPDDSTLWAGMSLNTSNAIFPYDTATQTTGALRGQYLSFSQRPLISPDGSKIYFASRSNSQGVYRFNTSTNSHYRIPGSSSYWYLDAALAGTKIFCTDGPNNSLRVFDTTTETLTGSISVANYPWDILASADGSTVYTFRNITGNSGSVIDVSSQTVTGTINSAGGRSACWNPQKTHIFLGRSGDLQVIDAADEVVVETYSIGNGNCGMVWHPNGKTLYSINSAGNAVQIIQ